MNQLSTKNLLDELEERDLSEKDIIRLADLIESKLFEKTIIAANLDQELKLVMKRILSKY